MYLHSLNILNYKNIEETQLEFSPKLNCLVGLNGQGKTNVLDSIYMLSYTKSAFNQIDSQNIRHDADMAMVQGTYVEGEEEFTISCGLKRGQKKQFRRNRTDYPRLIDHIGLIPLVIVSPQDQQLIEEGSDERRRFMDMVISMQDHIYLEKLTAYNALLKQRNALLKAYEDKGDVPQDLFEVLEIQMVPLANYIYEQRQKMISRFVPIFQSIYREIAGTDEEVSLVYQSQLSDRELGEALMRTRTRDLILGWTSQGIHKDDLTMQLGEYPLKITASQGQQKTYLISMKLSKAIYLGKPILLLDDIFDRLDKERVERIIQLVESDRFGQIFITDTNSQHLTDLLPNQNAKIFTVNHGQISE